MNVPTRNRVLAHMVPAELTRTRPAPPASEAGQSLPRTLWHRHRVPLLATLPALPLYAIWWAFLATGGGDLAAQYAWAASRPGTVIPLTTFSGTEALTPPTTASYLPT